MDNRRDFLKKVVAGTAAAVAAPALLWLPRGRLLSGCRTLAPRGGDFPCCGAWAAGPSSPQ